MKIVGVAGRDRSGKDTLAEMFMLAGFFGFSIGDANRRIARERHKSKSDPISVKNMTETSNWFRSKYGPDGFLKLALQEYKEAGNRYKGLVIYSIRAPIEADFILEHKGQLIWVESSDEVRYQRKIANLRQGEAKVTLQEMLAQEALQADPQPGIPREVQMDLNTVKAKATIILENNGNDIKVFEQKAQKLVDRLTKQ